MVITVQNVNRKPGYKQTEVGLIPEDWKIAKLGEVLTFQRGFDLPHKKRQSGHIPVVSSAGISGQHSEAKVLSPGVVTGRYGTIGQIFFINEDFWPLNTTLFVKEFKGNDPLFISFLLLTIDFKLHSDKSGVPGVNRNDLHQIAVILPPLPEQRAIATALSGVDRLITSLDKLIAKKRDIKQATMQQLLTGKTRLPGFSGEWEVRKLGELFQFLNTANNSRSDLSEEGEIKYIHYGDIHMKWESFLDCSKDELPLIQRDKVRNVPFLEDGDLVMADASEDYDGTGISVEVKNATGKKVVAGLHTFLLRGDKKALADGFKGYLQYIPAVKDALKKVATGISVYGISKNNVRNISICLPNIIEQQAIATILSDMDAEIAALEQKRDKTRALKHGMMQELLTGKTRLV